MCTGQATSSAHHTYGVPGSVELGRLKQFHKPGAWACPLHIFPKDMFMLPPQDTEKFMGGGRGVSTSATYTWTMTDTIGDSLLNGIKCQVVTLKRQLEYDYGSKLKKLEKFPGGLGTWKPPNSFTSR